VKVAAVALNYRDKMVIENGKRSAACFSFHPPPRICRAKSWRLARTRAVSLLASVSSRPLRSSGSMARLLEPLLACSPSMWRCRSSGGRVGAREPPRRLDLSDAQDGSRLPAAVDRHRILWSLRRHPVLLPSRYTARRIAAGFSVSHRGLACSKLLEYRLAILGVCAIWVA
jgi:hypothetical protein